MIPSTIQRNTVQRKIIFDTLKSLTSHPTAEDLLREVQKSHPTIGRATVYRNLRQLADSGLVLQLTTMGDVARYDGCTDPHYHFYCKVCHGFFDVEMGAVNEKGIKGEKDAAEHMNRAVERKYNFQVDRHDVTFTGSCGSCK